MPRTAKNIETPETTTPATLSLERDSRVYKLIGLTPLLGGQPASLSVRTDYIASKAPTDELRREELETFDLDNDTTGVTVFARDKQDRICLMAHQIKGFFKEALKAVSSQAGIAAVKGKVDTLLFVEPRFIPITRDGAPLREEDEMLERPLRAETRQGPRTALQSSEMLNDPWEVELEMTLVPNKGSGKSNALTWAEVELALQYGAYHGLGQWRNAGYGSFRFERVEDEE